MIAAPEGCTVVVPFDELPPPLARALPDFEGAIVEVIGRRLWAPRELHVALGHDGMMVLFQGLVQTFRGDGAYIIEDDCIAQLHVVRAGARPAAITHPAPEAVQ